MGAPDPEGVDVGYVDDRVTVHYEVWQHGNPKSRKARAIRILHMVGKDGEGWRCRYCGDHIPIFKRSDARYCTTHCRKASARERRRYRGQTYI